MLLALLPLVRDMSFGHFLNGRHENLNSAIFLLLIDLNLNFGVYTHFFRVKKSNETTYKNSGSFEKGEFEKVQDGDQ